jgi:8-oxo-(d)GTP phosphatase
MPARDVRAAGAVVTRKGGDVLLVHRPRYDDWSFPKGKLDPGEHPVTAAVREVAEETGLDVRLGPPLPEQRYRLATGRTKAVSYWTARVVGDDDVSGYLVNEEIDDVAWVPWDEARARLTYDYDRVMLDAARPLRRRTGALVVLRHAQARPRDEWCGDDRLRPLVDSGRAQADRLVPLLAGFGVAAVHTSPSTRCVETVAPYADTTGLPLLTHDGLTEEHASTPSVASLVGDLLEARAGVVVCSHRPVLPLVLAAMGIQDDVRLGLGEMLVVHHRKRRVVATERHLA